MQIQLWDENGKPSMKLIFSFVQKMFKYKWLNYRADGAVKHHSSRVMNPSWGASQDGRPGLMELGEKG